MEARAREVQFFLDKGKKEPVKEWLKSLRRKKKFVEHQKILTRISRAELGNFGDHRMVGKSWGELRIDFGPGYRLYFGIDGDRIILLLHGGTKKRQEKDIEVAEQRWKSYLKSRGEKR